ncbi:MAG: outer membrane beta-barrel protein [Waterburya sp.]
MLTKNNYVASTTIAISTSLMISGIAQAEKIESYEDYKLYCGYGAYQYNVQSPDCDKFKSSFEERYQQEQSQPVKKDTQDNTSTQQKSSNDGIKGYLGVTTGLFFPDEEFLNTGLGVSLYSGAKFNKYFATDIEVGLLGGGTEVSEFDYEVFAAFINPRFIFPLTDKENSASVYLSPGIGLSSLGITISENDEEITLTDETRFTWQIKTGISLPVSKRFSTFGQIRYASQAQDSTVDFWGTEIGLNFEF